MSLAVLLVSHQTTYIRLKVSLPFKKNRVKPVQESNKSLDPSIFQQSSMRRSSITSKFVRVVLETSMYFSINREWFFSRQVKFDSGFNVIAVYEVSSHGPEVICPFTDIRKWVLRWLRKRPLWLSKKISLTFSSNWVIPHQGGCCQFLISSRKFNSSICGWKNGFSISLGIITSFALSLLE